MNSKFFNSKYPIVEASMNQGSSLDLAVAVHHAGAFPSLFLTCENYTNSYDLFDQFRTLTNSTNVVIPMARHHLLDKNWIKMLYDFSPSHIEIFPSDKDGLVDDYVSYFDDLLISSALKFLKNRSKIIMRLYQPLEHKLADHFDAFYIKGLESAGKTGSWTVKDLFLKQKMLTPDKVVIPFGGIGTPEQVHWYLNHGAEAVGVGTVFAACKESPLSLEMKQKMLKLSSSDITQLADTQQNCVVLGNNLDTESDWNRSNSLKQGINGDGTQGHLYLGHSINHIDKIRTVHEAVQYLCSSL